MKKILFLDIDGVLVTRSWWERRPEYKHLEPGEFDPDVQVMFENWLAAHPDVYIVLSSTWRGTGKVHPEKIPFGWKYRIGKESKIIVSRIVDVTPHVKSGIRGEEIQQWLDSHPEITNYVIIDDDSDMLDSQLSNFVQTKFFDGLNESHLSSVSQIISQY